MSEAQLSIRSTRALVLARQLARDEHRTIAKVVELALEDRARARKQETQSAQEFVSMLRKRDPDDTIDIDLEALRDDRRHGSPP